MGFWFHLRCTEYRPTWY